jgi:hypothetical protein
MHDLHRARMYHSVAPLFSSVKTKKQTEKQTATWSSLKKKVHVYAVVGRTPAAAAAAPAPAVIMPPLLASMPKNTRVPTNASKLITNMATENW